MLAQTPAFFGCVDTESYGIPSVALPLIPPPRCDAMRL